MVSDVDDVDADFQFATAVIGYGLLLRHSEFKGALSWDWVAGNGSRSSKQRSAGPPQRICQPGEKSPEVTSCPVSRRIFVHFLSLHFLSDVGSDKKFKDKK